jgi:ParB/RepB/Spo0J family partition protein
MLSGEHESVAIDFIWVDREKRIRREITEAAIAEKAESISRIGLIHAPVIKRDGELVAGETRWRACTKLGWDRIPIQWSDTLDDREHLMIELEENVKRTDLTWQDQCAAMKRLHELHRELDPEWSVDSTADSVGITRVHVYRLLSVAKAIEAGDTRVASAPKFSVAHGITKRTTARRQADELSSLLGDEPATPLPAPESPILNANFLEWVQTYDGAPFNLIHCDFPYGINADKFQQGAGAAYGGYEDSPDTYWALVRGLVENKEKLLGSSGHVIFWFSMRYYTETLEALREHFWVDPYPLIWVKSDNKGTLPDPERGPRRVYEVAFLCSHGDRKIVSAVANTFSAPTVRTGEHMSEKNEEMLRHFMRMVVDEGTSILDPTCGSGSALRAAAALGARRVVGLELNPEFALNAQRAFAASRAGLTA